MNTRHDTRKQHTGTPGNGGEYAEAVKDASDKPLLDEDDRLHNEQGSFLYPPPPRNPQQFIDFWENVTVSDDILRGFDDRYNARLNALGEPARRRKIQAYCEDKMREFDEAAERRRNEKDYVILWRESTEGARQRQRDKEEEQRRLAFNDFLEEAEEKIPPATVRDVHVDDVPYPMIGRSSIRPLARAGAMFSYLPPEGIWTEEAREVVLEHRVDLGLNNVLTVREIEEKYRLSEINGYLLQ